MGRLLDTVHEHTPVFFQNCLCTFHGAVRWHERYGGRFRESLRWLEETDRWSLDRLMAYQDEQVRRIVALAYEEVPFWKRRFDSLGVRPQDIRTVDDLRGLPILTKAEVQDAGRQIHNPRISSRQLVHGHTSGSTGAPLDMIYVKDTIRFTWALWWRHKRWYGVDLHHRQANFGWQPVVPYRQARPPFWRHNWWGRQTVVSHYHMKPEFLDHYVEFLNRRAFDYFSGYPSSICALADHMESRGLALRNRPIAVFTGSENTEEFQRALIEKHVGPISSHYGGAEFAANASQCPDGVYHVDMEYGVLEIVPIEGVQQEPGKLTGKIVATGFTNPAMPLIRYDMTDVGTLVLDHRCPCGRPTPALERIDGRRDSYLVTTDGRRVGRVSQVFMGRPWVREAQIIQERVGQLRVSVVQRREPSSDEVRGLQTEVQKYVGADTTVEVEFVAEIPRSRAGKFRAVVSLVDGVSPRPHEGRPVHDRPEHLSEHQA